MSFISGTEIMGLTKGVTSPVTGDLSVGGNLAVTGTFTLTGACALAGGTTLTDGTTVVNSANATGTSIWAASDKGAFFGGTPVVRQVGASQGAASQTQTSLTDSTAGTPGTTLAACTDLSTAGGNTYTDAAVNTKLAVLRNWAASLAAELALVKTDVATLVTLTNALRTALVNLNLVKGAA